MEFKEVTNKEQWDKKIGSQAQSQFLQSWYWGEFQEKIGRKIWRLDLSSGYILVIKMPLPMKKSYLYIPRTKIVFDRAEIEALKELARQENSIFIKIETFSDSLVNLGAKAVKTIQPKKTLLLDLSLSEEDLLGQMHQKTRYNIRLAAKKGVHLYEGQTEEFPIFYDLLLDTYRRKGKKLYGRQYFQKLYHDHLAKIYLAKYIDETLCANLIVSYGDTMTYLHGGSSEKDKNIMAPHFLQWEIIKKAKAAGYKYYDFWGVEDHYPGVSRFKKGFGGIEVEYGGAYDFVIDKPWYWLYRLIKKFR